MKNSQFLKKEDVGPGILVTIRDCAEENVALPGATPEMKWALHFDEVEKPLILNQTNGTLIQGILGSAESNDWIGKKIVLYSDPNIMYAGKLVGGIRVRAPRIPKGTVPARAVAKPAEPQPEAPPANWGNEDDPDNVPF